MIEFEAKVRRWGNSMGIVLPKEIIKERRLKSNQSIKIMIPPQGDMMEMWGVIARSKKVGREKRLKDFESLRKESRKTEWKQLKEQSSSTRGRR